MDPLALLPYALAAAGGRVEHTEASRLVTAGLTLLQRSATLVRALSGRQTGILLPNGPSLLVALAASDGRAAVLLDHADAPDSRAAQLARHRVGVIFTTSDLAADCPASIPRVLLDEGPVRAIVLHDDRATTIDMGTHFALDLVGDTETEGSREPCLIHATSNDSFSHAALLTAARTALAQFAFTPVDRTVMVSALTTPSAMVHGFIAPLLAGGQLLLPHTGEEIVPEQLANAIVRHSPTILVGERTRLDRLLASSNAETPPRAHSSTTFKRVVCPSTMTHELTGTLYVGA